MDNMAIELYIAVIIAPIIAYIMYLKKMKDRKLEYLETRMNKIDKDVAVSDAKIDGIEADIKEINESLKKIAERPRGWFR